MWKQPKHLDGLLYCHSSTFSKAQLNPLTYTFLQIQSMTCPGLGCKALTWATIKTRWVKIGSKGLPLHIYQHFMCCWLHIFFAFLFKLSDLHYCITTFEHLFSRALINVMKNHSHLMRVDTLSARSCLYLMPMDDLVECSININPELLDMLHVFTNIVPTEITAISFQVSIKWLIGWLIETSIQLKMQTASLEYNAGIVVDLLLSLMWI